MEKKDLLSLNCITNGKERKGPKPWMNKQWYLWRIVEGSYHAKNNYCETYGWNLRYAKRLKDNYDWNSPNRVGILHKWIQDDSRSTLSFTVEEVNEKTSKKVKTDNE